MPDMCASTWQVVELFAGAGNVSAAFRQCGKSVASFDKEMGGSCMDITLSAGFLSRAEFFASGCFAYVVVCFCVRVFANCIIACC